MQHVLVEAKEVTAPQLLLHPMSSLLPSDFYEVVVLEEGSQTECPLNSLSLAGAHFRNGCLEQMHILPQRMGNEMVKREGKNSSKLHLLGREVQEWQGVLDEG